MRIHESLQREIEKTKSQSRTTSSLRRFILGVVDESLREHYGDNYSDRCLQSSMAISETHKFLGIECSTRNGFVCFLRISIKNDKPEFGWGGFWDQDDHSWAYNQFGELIDLTISQLHLHPASISKDALPIPAIWWDDVSRMPSIMIYIPNGRPVADFSESEKIDTENFMDTFRKNLKDKAKSEIGSGYSEAILSGASSLDALMEKRHPWVFLGCYMQDLPMPHWILKRIEELNNAYQD